MMSFPSSQASSYHSFHPPPRGTLPPVQHQLLTRPSSSSTASTAPVQPAHPPAPYFDAPLVHYGPPDSSDPAAAGQQQYPPAMHYHRFAPTDPQGPPAPGHPLHHHGAPPPPPHHALPRAPVVAPLHHHALPPIPQYDRASPPVYYSRTPSHEMMLRPGDSSSRPQAMYQQQQQQQQQQPQPMYQQRPHLQQPSYQPFKTPVVQSIPFFHQLTVIDRAYDQLARSGSLHGSAALANPNNYNNNMRPVMMNNNGNNLGMNMNNSSSSSLHRHTSLNYDNRYNANRYYPNRNNNRSASGNRHQNQNQNRAVNNGNNSYNKKRVVSIDTTSYAQQKYGTNTTKNGVPSLAAQPHPELPHPVLRTRMSSPLLRPDSAATYNGPSLNIARGISPSSLVTGYQQTGVSPTQSPPRTFADQHEHSALPLSLSLSALSLADDSHLHQLGHGAASPSVAPFEPAGMTQQLLASSPSPTSSSSSSLPFAYNNTNNSFSDFNGNKLFFMRNGSSSNNNTQTLNTIDTNNNNNNDKRVSSLPVFFNDKNNFGENNILGYKQHTSKRLSTFDEESDTPRDSSNNSMTTLTSDSAQQHDAGDASLSLTSAPASSSAGGTAANPGVIGASRLRKMSSFYPCPSPVSSSSPSSPGTSASSATLPPPPLPSTSPSAGSAGGNGSLLRAVSVSAGSSPTRTVFSPPVGAIGSHRGGGGFLGLNAGTSLAPMESLGSDSTTAAANSAAASSTTSSADNANILGWSKVWGSNSAATSVWG